MQEAEELCDELGAAERNVLFRAMPFDTALPSSICQDRLGTNMEEELTKRTLACFCRDHQEREDCCGGGADLVGSCVW